MSSSAVANLSSLKSDVDDINGKMGTMDIEDKEEMVMVEKDGEEEKKGGYEQQDIIMDDKQVDISNWDKKEFMELERLLHNCIPLIRFFQITANDFHDNILPFSQILPKNLFDDILKFHFKRSCLPNFSVSSISKLIPNTKILPPRSLHFDSTLLKAEQVARLVDWIDRNLADGKVSRVTRCNYAIRIKDKSHGPCFGDKDLWMKNNFNGYDSCSSDKDDYLDRVTTLSKFW
ncbi:418_t:CDS:2, partial [Entrophospora sp. SA101]